MSPSVSVTLKNIFLIFKRNSSSDLGAKIRSLWTTFTSEILCCMYSDHF